MTRSINIHATCVRLGRHGILLIGKSGSGKSDLALRLIARGAKLVADDRCDISVERNRLVARAPRSIEGLLEVRGVGIVPVAHARSAEIALVADLSGTVVRLPSTPRYAPPAPLALRQSAQPSLICLNAFEASAPDKIVAALGLIGQRRSGAAVKRN
jgi:hypothetical protein